MKSPAYYASLSKEARLQRIGEILAKGIFLVEQARQAEVRQEKQVHIRAAVGGASGGEALLDRSGMEVKAPDAAGTVTNPISQTPAHKIISFLAETGEASPQEIQLKHGLSRSKTYRLLTKLQQDGKVEKTGSTRAIRYWLAT